MTEVNGFTVPDDVGGLVTAMRGGGVQEDLLPESLSSGDPTTQLLARMLLQNRDNGASDDAAEDDHEERRLARARAEARRRAMRQLAAELDVLRRRNDRLAASLGACPRCWGADLTCEECDGWGRPGSEVPDPGLYAAWVAPAVRRIRAQSVARQGPGPTDGDHNQAEPEAEGVDA
ncbi:hypothetical protein [Demequina rhizosphaerae]|uniref:hypothetical protein n=1 Tax=Demequina rhizosphaerae TaxID=1638985 RepID=UPI000B133C96|nr:hypothetical protein [Demequina rhizosphaerae]